MLADLPPLSRMASQTPPDLDSCAKVWPSFDPGRFVDMNPGFLRRAEDEAWVVFTRYATPPRPGSASVWAVRADQDGLPLGEPVLLIADGHDPRVIDLEDGRALVFYVIAEHDAERQRITGTSIAVAEFTLESQRWQHRRGFVFPKRPLSGTAIPKSIEGWEKNWIPFRGEGDTVNLIYAHEPWQVLQLSMPPDTAPRFLNAWHGPGLRWEHGTIRGGTPPVRHDEGHLITFFHASEIVGSRRIYSVGACVFQDRPPYAPVSLTTEPLFIAPYRRGVHRFGWPFAISVIFPGGAERIGDSYRMFCGQDDGEIALLEVERATLTERLRPVRPQQDGALHDYHGNPSTPLPSEKLLYVPAPVPGFQELPMVSFLRVLAGRGRTFVDAGAHIGFYAMGLAPGFDRVLAYEPSRFQYGWLRRNRALNDYDHVQCEQIALGDAPGEALLHVFNQDGGLNSLSAEVAGRYQAIDRYSVPVETLDSRGLTDVDLLKIDVEGFEIPVLRGAARTIAASRPVILLETWAEPEPRQRVQAVLDEMGYTFEFIFPRAPELALCLPAERRAQYHWFV